MPSIFTRLGTSSPVTETQISYAPLDGFKNAVQGDIVFDVPEPSSLKAKTHFWAYGLDKTSVRPLVILHGGPGIPSNYLSPMVDLAAFMPIIIYDQIGCGASSHFPETMGDTSFWVEKLFIAELHNLLKVIEIADDYAVFGHSWGGVLGSAFASEQPAGLKKLVLSSTPVSIDLWLEAANRLRALLPKDKCDALEKHEKAGTTEDPEYQAAVTAFYDLHVIRVVPNPPDVKAALSAVGEDPTVYLTMNGPNEFHITGPLKDWSGVANARKIAVPTLITNGKYDEGQDSCIEPWSKLIPGSKWTRFENSSHMAFWEEREAYISAIKEFLL